MERRLPTRCKPTNATTEVRSTTHAFLDDIAAMKNLHNMNLLMTRQTVLHDSSYLF